VNKPKEPRWLTRAIVEAIHTDQIRQHGGSFGIRDGALLESALGRPRNRWHYEPEVELSELGAAYGFGIAKNHPFIDGNKRAAFQAMYVFMGLNGWRIRASEDEVVSIMESVAAGGADEANLADWLREHMVRWRRRRT
jgi:death-on-curing protein